MVSMEKSHKNATGDNPYLTAAAYGLKNSQPGLDFLTSHTLANAHIVSYYAPHTPLIIFRMHHDMIKKLAGTKDSLQGL